MRVNVVKVLVIDKLMNDKKLIDDLKNADHQAFREFVEQYENMVVNTCYGFLRNQEDAEDIAQEVFIEIYRAIHHFREEASLSTWIYRIAVNKSLNLIKKNKRKKWANSIQAAFGNEEDSEPFTDTKTPNPQISLEQQERIQILYKAIDSLAENQKVAFTLSKFEDFDYKQIAEIMGTTVSAVESLLNRAKKNLQKKLYNYYKDI